MKICLKKGLLLLLWVSIFTSWGQEICNNGIDDDLNGDIDLLDDACLCQRDSIIDILPNPSFEDTLGCPTSWSQMDSAAHWLQPTFTTADFIHKCGYIPRNIIGTHLESFPDGNGVVGIIMRNDWKEYVAANLLSPFKKGNTYKVSLDIAAINLQTSISTPLPYDSLLDDLEPIELTLFGYDGGLASLPLPGFERNGPQNTDPNWKVVGSVLYDPEANWSTLEIEFTPDFDIHSFIIGTPPGLLPPNYPTHLDGSIMTPYFMMDNLTMSVVIYEVNADLDMSGTYCDGERKLYAVGESLSGASYEWFYNNNALATEEDSVLIIPDGQIGEYTLRLEKNGRCTIKTIIAELESINAPEVIVQQPTCDLQIGRIEVDTLVEQYSFDGGLSWVKEPVFEMVSPGEYVVHIQTKGGCVLELDKVELSYDCDPIDLWIPDAITVNADGKNDAWHITGLEARESISITVYNRYGNVVFKSDSWEKEWEGESNTGEPLPAATYYYVIETVDFSGINQEFVGSVTLFR